MISRMMSELPWDVYERRLADDDAIVIVPVGAVEQHGYHLPLGTDWLMATYMARRAADNLDAIVADPIAYGARSQVRTGGGPHRCGTTSLNAETLIALVHDVLVEIGRHGARKIAVIDSHFENRFFLDEACHRAQETLSMRGREARILKMLYAERIQIETLQTIYAGVEHPPGLDLEHGGVLETAMMLYCYPDLVDTSRITDEAPPRFPPYDLFPVNPDWVPASGSLSSGRTASRQIGELLVEEFVTLVTDSLRKEFHG